MQRLWILLLLTGCTHAVTLMPRSGGEKAYGEFNDGSRTMTVTIRGETYTGDYSRGSGVGVSLGAGGAISPGFGISNQHAALLIGAKGNVRCEWILEAFGGNGVCMDPENNVYDLLVGRK